MSRRGRPARITFAAAGVLLGVTAGDLHGQQRLAPGDTVMARPARQYEAGGVHRWLLGDGYRELWSIEIPVEVLDLETFAGGLVPLQRGGGQQTRSLRFSGADGLVYNFRSIDKDVSPSFDPQLRQSLAADVMQDQISSLMPLSAMVVSPLLDALEVFHPQPRLRVMPDDPRLGEFRAEFAGLLGWIELRPDEGIDDTPGFADSERVIGSVRLYERLEDGSDDLVDQRAYLRARYLDFLVGDWDRHPDQWRWAGFPDTIADREVTLFQPVPRDRDWALARLDGLIQTIASVPYPQYVGFGYDYPSAFALSWNGRGLDRKLLNALDSAAFAEIARDVVDRITPEVIRAAVRSLPDAYYEVVGPTIERNLEHRRERLPAFAQEYYELLSPWVDIDATDEDELVRVERGDDGTTTVSVFDLRDGEPRAEPWYRRTFQPGQTREVRIYARGGDDTIEVSGANASPIFIRVIGGGGDDSVVDRTDGSSLRVHDHRGQNRFELGRRASLDEAEWDAPDDPEAELHGARSRDWGGLWVPGPVLGVNPDDGAVLGASMTRIGYDFRHFPWRDRIDLSASVATETGRPNFGAGYRIRARSSPLGGELRVDWFGSRADRFHGFGNDTEIPGPDEVYRARRSELRLLGGVRIDLSGRASFRFDAGYTRFEAEANQGTLIADLEPYGYGTFDLFEFDVAARLDRRDAAWRPRSGWLLDVGVGVAPAALDVTDTFGWMEGEFSSYVSSESLPFRPTLALRVGARHVLGTYPYFAGASIGGAESLRGFRNQRFLGDAAVATSLELRGSFGRFFVLFPGEIGFLALVDGGRVWLDGLPSDEWHAAGGGGVWISLVDRFAGTLTIAGGEQVAAYISFGLPF